VASSAVIEGLRLVRAALAREPSPIIAGDLQPVLQASAWLASGALTAQYDTGDVPADVARQRALRFIDHQLSCLILGERPWAAGDPPLQLDGPG
jgi:hypothetical protein